MAYLLIDGVTLPAPLPYEPEYADLDSENSGRGEDGVMKRDRVRAGVVNLAVSWQFLTDAQMTTVINALSPASFDFTFRAHTGLTTKRGYCSHKKAKVAFMDGAVPFWHVQAAIIEV